MEKHRSENTGLFRALIFFPAAHGPGSSLPRAPKLKMFCMYGIGLRTERAYSYTEPTSVDGFGQIDYRAHSGNWEFILNMFGEMI